MKRILFIIFLLNLTLFAQQSSLRLLGMGSMEISVPDGDRLLNLYQFAGNMAWLKANDSLNWGWYSSENKNEWGNLKRNWDADALHLAQLVFSGQRHISETQVFYGRVCYNHDFHRDVHNAIERQPYAKDPFVLTDLTTGDFTWYGPSTFVAYSQRLFTDLYLGISIDYGIQHGQKAQNSMPEIISRDIRGSLDVAWQINPNFVAGFSYKPYDHQDVTLFANLPDGSAVFTERFRGEIKYNYHVGTTDRTASYKGHEERVQLSFMNDSYEIVLYGGYTYLWHELFDGSTTHTYDGYYQDESYFFNSAIRRHFNNTSLTLAYHFNYSEDWAKEPVADFLIYRAKYTSHLGSIGFSHQFTKKPVLLASELVYESITPDRRDYLGHQLRKGENINLEWHTGIELNTDQPWRFRAGFIYSKFSEDEVWNYFGSHQGPGFTFGFGYYGSRYQVEGAYRYKRVEKADTHKWDSRVMRENMDVYLSLKQYF